MFESIIAVVNLNLLVKNSSIFNIEFIVTITGDVTPFLAISSICIWSTIGQKKKKKKMTITS